MKKSPSNSCEARRRFLGRAGGALSAVLISGWVGCGPKRPDPETTARRAAAWRGGLDCEDAAGLYPAERVRRTANEYIDRSARAPEYCFNCQYYVAPKEPGTCASCAIIPGPVHPLGWCKLWLFDPRR